MGKLTTYILIMTGLMILFYFAGLTDTSSLLNILLDPSGYENSGIVAQALLVLTGVTTAGIIIIGIATHNVELALMSTFTIWLLRLLWDFVGVFNKVHSENPVIAILLFSPLLFLFVITMVDWWRGKD